MYYLNANVPGYLPDSDPLEFETLEELETAIYSYANSLCDIEIGEVVVWLIDPEDVKQQFIEGHSMVDFAVIPSYALDLNLFAYRTWEK